MHNAAIPPESYGKALGDTPGAACVWGVGHIGYNTLIRLAEVGIAGRGLDIDAQRVEAVNDGRIPFSGGVEWLGEEAVTLSRTGSISATTPDDRTAYETALVHFVSVPTELDGQPWLEALERVTGQILDTCGPHRVTPPLIIVESTLVPGITDRVVLTAARDRGLAQGVHVLVAGSLGSGGGGPLGLVIRRSVWRPNAGRSWA